MLSLADEEEYDKMPSSVDSWISINCDASGIGTFSGPGLGLSGIVGEIETESEETSNGAWDKDNKAKAGTGSWGV